MYLERPFTMAAKWLFAAILLLSPVSGWQANAQSISVSPVNILFAPGQKVAALTLTNNAQSEVAIQIATYAWSQQTDSDKLDDTDIVIASPPMTTVPPGGSQVVRIVLRQAAASREESYRLFVEQIPTANKPGTVQMLLRLSIPIFAQPASKATSHLQFHVEVDGEKLFFAALNDGLRHEVLREIALTAADGRKLKISSGTSPYVLSGATHRWPVAIEGEPLKPGDSLHLTAKTDAGSIDQEVRVSAVP